MEYNKFIDHTLLKANAKATDIEKLCNEAIKYDFKSVCINPRFISYAKSLLANTNVLVCTVIGFPLGSNTKETKVFETKNAISLGANEIDMVINVSDLLDKRYDNILSEIRDIKNACGYHTLKVIIETCYLSKDEIKKVCEIAKKAGADYVKTSTGFGSAGAQIDDVKLMRETVGEEMGVKASGGIRCKKDFLAMIEAGANRIGTSNGVTIMEELLNE